MASMRDVLSKESLRALEQLGRSPVSKPQRQRPKTVVHNGKTLVLRQPKDLPFILGVIQSVGCDTIYLEDRSGLVIVGLVIAHWTKEELVTITEAIEANQFMYKKTWRNTWAVVITC